MRASGESISLARPASAVTATFSGRPFSPISNRNFQQLEIVVTATKPSPKLSLIDNEKLLFRKIACRAGCLPTIKPARSKQPRCRTTTRSTNFRPTNPATSNRQWKGLEIAVTPTKHSPDPSLIDNEKQLFRKIACRAGCLPTIKPALSNQPRRRTATHSTKSRPANPAISNRNWIRLEIAVTNKKHSPDTNSNRYENTSAPATFQNPFLASSQLPSPPHLANATVSQHTCLTQWAPRKTRRRRSNAMLGATTTSGVARVQRNARLTREHAETPRKRHLSRASTVITHWKQSPELAPLYHCDCSGAFIHYAQIRHSSVRIGGFFVTAARGVGVAFVRRKGNTYFLVHNVRRQGKVRQLHLARLGERPKITDDVVRSVSRNHPFLQLDWSSLREQVNNRAPVFDVRSPYVQTLMHALRNLNLDLADLTPPMLVLADRANSSRELVTQLRLLRATLDIKLNQFERGDLAVANGGRKFR